MKLITILSIAAIFFTFQSCTKSVSDCKEVSYDEIISAKLGDRFCLPDGKEFEVKDIEDSRCPCNVECIWEGAIIVYVELTKKNDEKENLMFNDSKGVLKNDKSEGFVPDLLSYKTIQNDSCVINSAKDFILEIVVKK
jgi:hypothetical protein